MKVRKILFSRVCELKQIAGNLEADVDVHVWKMKVKCESEKDIVLPSV